MCRHDTAPNDLSRPIDRNPCWLQLLAVHQVHWTVKGTVQSLLQCITWSRHPIWIATLSRSSQWRNVWTYNWSVPPQRLKNDLSTATAKVHLGTTPQQKQKHRPMQQCLCYVITMIETMRALKQTFQSVYNIVLMLLALPNIRHRNWTHRLPAMIFISRVYTDHITDLYWQQHLAAQKCNGQSKVQFSVFHGADIPSECRRCLSHQCVWSFGGD